MNTLLHIADSVLQYHRGKQTGLWGLIGIALGILAVAFWDEIVPFFDYIGLVDFFDNLGILHSNAPYMSAFKIFMFFFMASITFMILGWVLLGVFGMVMGMAQNSFIQKLFILLIAIVFSPIIMAIMIYYMLFSKTARKERKLMRDDPEAYKEEMRLGKNKRQIDFMKYGPKGDKNNSITYEEAYNRLNRLPSFGDHLYLIGVTHDREIYMLLPGAIQLREFYKKPGEVYSEQLNVLVENVYGQGKTVTQKYKIELTNPNTNRKTIMDIPSISLNEFEEFIDPSNIKLVDNFFRKYCNSKMYEQYVEDVLKYFFGRKDRVIREIQEANTEEEYKALYEELQNHQAPNEEIVRMVWDAHKAKQIEEEERINKHSIY